MKRYNLLRDALEYTNRHSGASVEKAQGVVIGVVSMIMALEHIDFYDAIEIVKAHMPVSYRLDAIPESWRSEFK